MPHRMEEQASARTTAVGPIPLVPLNGVVTNPIIYTYPLPHFFPSPFPRPPLPSPVLRPPPPHVPLATLKAPPRAPCPRGRGPTEAAHITLSPKALGLGGYEDGPTSHLCLRNLFSGGAREGAQAYRCEWRCSDYVSREELLQHSPPGPDSSTTRAAFDNVWMHPVSLTSLPFLQAVVPAGQASTSTLKVKYPSILSQPLTPFFALASGLCVSTWHLAITLSCAALGPALPFAS